MVEIILIKNGQVIDPASGKNGVADVLIEDGKIAKVAKNIKAQNTTVIDAKACWVLPGLIDMHTHLRDPGWPEQETIATGTRAAARGGFTSVCCMANTDPVADTASVVKYIVSKAKAEGVVNVFPIGAVTKGLKGEELAEMGRMLDEGAVAFSDDGHPIASAGVFRKALEYAGQFNVPIISHSEELGLSESGDMNEGALSTQLGLRGIPALAESEAVARDVGLAKEFGTLHVAHVSTAQSVKTIRDAKKQKVKVTCETAPHYFSLTEEAVKGYDTNAKVNPPLRTQADVEEIVAGLKDDTIDVIATDHAPHTIDEKNVEFQRAANGMIGLETAVPLCITKLIKERKMNPLKVFAKLTVNPAKILKLNKGTLAPGADADVVIIDPEAKVVIKKEDFVSASKNSPFISQKLTGKVLTTVVGGKIVFQA
ncbi:MAG: dihydroorotase [Candidatus Margulisbacteria bacterium]|nr:dihydroorotase [Candidatus Margulisiibacteriota bacterium]MBU1021927.1 dihydroorotase [Candidatus Margulisiibacteriota bacterium]MBU1728906.1 dihydroorotase [Candidatus Margulisiibacteriota bacterium]MBU1954712.1 dihydroorotase [Candidatus Margulisiibacteriota bacterium]